MLFGIDCAAVDKNKADWSQAKAAGPVSFAIIRAAWGNDRDTTFAREWPALKAAGLTRGAYLFLRYPWKGVKPAAPDAQAQACVDIVGELGRDDLPVSIDLEFPGNGRTDTGMSAVAHQSDNELVADGIVGPRTFASLCWT